MAKLRNQKSNPPPIAPSISKYTAGNHHFAVLTNEDKHQKKLITMLRRRKAGQDQVSEGSENRARVSSSGDGTNTLRTPTVQTIRNTWNNTSPYLFLPVAPGKHMDDLVPYPCIFDKTELETAFENGDHSATIEYLLQKSKRAMIHKFHIEGAILDLKRVVVLDHLLPYIEKLDCRPISYTSHGLIHLLRCIRQNRSVKELKLLHLPSQLLASNEKVRSELQNLLQNNESLTTVRISIQQGRIESVFHHEFSASTIGNDNACFRAICMAFRADKLQPNKTKSNIQVLELVDFHVQGQAFCKFLTCPCIPPDLKFRRFRITGAVEDWYDYSNSPVKYLTMTGCALAPQCSKGVLDGVAQLPKLLNFNWCAWEYFRRSYGSSYERIDMTDAVMKLLQKGVIESLSSMTSFVVIRSLCDALKTNKSLRMLQLGSTDIRQEDEHRLLDVLKNNTTLCEIGRVASEKVKYYCNLNKYGRSQARDLTTTKPEFVGLLWVANESHAFVTDLERSRVLYGLLKEMPTVWSQ